MYPSSWVYHLRSSGLAGNGAYSTLSEKFLWQADFPLSEEFGRAFVKVHSGTRRIDQHPLILLELRVSGLGEDKSLDAIWRWFDMAHEWIVRTFFDITSPEMHDYWGRRND